MSSADEYATCTILSFTSSHYLQEPPIGEMSHDMYSITLQEHPEGQTKNVFKFNNKVETTLFTFNLVASSSESVHGSVELDVSGINGISPDNVENIILYKDVDGNAEYTKDVDIFAGFGDFMISEKSNGSIHFDNLFLVIGESPYVVIVDTHAIKSGKSMVVSLTGAQIYLNS